METITIKTGEKASIKINFFLRLNIVYCGMPNGDTFAISGMEGGTGQQGFGFNIYYPKGTKEITVKNYRFRVLEVKPDSILLQKVTSK